MSAEKNKAADRRFYEELINRKNLAIIDELADEDFVSHFTPPASHLVEKVSKSS